MNDIFLEIDKLLKHKFTSYVRILVRSMETYKYSDIHNYIIKLRALNNLIDSDEKKIVGVEMIKRLIISINNLDNGDSHATGLSTNVMLYSNKAQEILSFKQLKKSAVTSNSKIIPNLDNTILYSNSTQCKRNVTWIRCKLNVCDPSTILDGSNNISKWILSSNPYYQIPNTNIFEFYFVSVSKAMERKRGLAIINEFDSHSNVLHIIFYSNCRMLSDIHSNKMLVYSNVLKFYYCYLSNNNDFTIITSHDMDIFKNVNTLIIRLIKSQNFNNINIDDECVTPMSALSGFSPHTKVFKFAKKTEPLTELDKAIYQANGSFAGTSISRESYERNEKHKTYTIENDRDSRIIGRGSLFGGRNGNELSIHSNAIQK